MDYFSDRENGPIARIDETVSPSAWGGVVAIIQALVNTGAFGFRYPVNCPDGAGPIGTDENSLSLAVRAEIPGLDWPLKTLQESQEDFSFYKEPFAPLTSQILDLIEFCFRSVGKPIQDGYHKYFNHHHLSFDETAGRSEFRDGVNRIFARNGIAFELTSSGRIERLGPPVLREQLASLHFLSGDGVLDQMLEVARQKFLSPNVSTRMEAVERLWDCWERLKSQAVPTDKKLAVALLLDRAAPEPQFRRLIETEATALTRIGNDFQIRHSEVSKIPITSSAHIDYLFHRLFCLISLLLKR